MKENNTDQIDFRAIFNVIIEKKFFIVIFTSFFSISVLVYSILIPNIYESRAILAPSSLNENLASQLSSFSSLAGLAGVSLPAGDASKDQEAVERMKSYEFFSDFIYPNIKVENLIAIKKWLPQSNEIIYKDDTFDSKNNKWVREVSYPKMQVPTRQEAFREFIKHINISVDKKTSFVTISIKHKSGVIAERWLSMIIKNINESMRQEDIEISSNSILYLESKAQSTKIQSLKDAISNLLESQMKTLMFASSNEDYIFKIIDSPIIPEQKISPQRSLICIFGFLIGLILSIAIVLFQKYFLKK